MKTETKKPPVSVLGYLKSSMAAYKAFGWAWQNTMTPGTKKWTYRMLFWTLFFIVAYSFQPSLMSWVFDTLALPQEKRDGQTLIYVGIAFFVLLILQRYGEKKFFDSREWLLGLSNIRLDNRITEMFFEKSIGQHVHQNALLSPTGIKKGRERLFALQSVILFDALPTIAQLGFSFIFLFILSWSGGLILSSILAVYIAWSFYLNYQIDKQVTPIEKDMKALNRRRDERFERVERVKVCAREKAEHDEMHSIHNGIMDRDRSFWLWFIGNAFFRGIVNAIGLTSIMAWGTYLVWKGEMNIGFLYPLFAWSIRVSENIWRLGSIEQQISYLMPSVHSMIKALTIAPDIVDAKDASKISSSTSHSVEFRNIGYTYPPESTIEDDVVFHSNAGKDEEGDESEGTEEGSESTKGPPASIKKFNLTIHPGEKVALLGPSGSGKSTIMKLLQRFSDPTEGEILIDGINLRDIEQASWRKGIGYIPQQAQLLDGTIRYNLTYRLPDDEKAAITDEQLWTLMRRLEIDFKDRLTNGLDTKIGKGGIKLSGGQAQRLMIGAAVIGNPWLIIIDEATSSLDSTTEKKVQEGLAQVLSDAERSAIIIAHRLSTVRYICDRFVVLKPANEVEGDEPQIEAVASSFEELYAKSPTFRSMADDQGMAISPLGEVIGSLHRRIPESAIA